MFNHFLKLFFCSLIILPVLSVIHINAEQPVPDVSAIYVSDLANPVEFTLFANTGWDGGWFVGHSKNWIQKIEIPENKDIIKAFIGAKLGRMKTIPVEEKPEWESTAVPGSLYISISSTPTMKNSEKYFLTTTEDIPYEGLPEVALKGVGESRWFWAEVPLDRINFGSSNYIAVWSNSKKLKDAGSTPIIAAGYDLKDKEKNTWLNPDADGKLPETASSGTKPISYFDPAIAVKLIPQNAYSVYVHLKSISAAESDSGKLYFAATVSGVNIEKVWIEISIKGNNWSRYNRYLYNTPYIFTLNPLTLPKERFQLRAGAMDELGNIGYSAVTELLNK